MELPPSDHYAALGRLFALSPDFELDLQLAAALLWAREIRGGRDFVCLHERLRIAAILEGFQVLPEAV